MTVLLIVTIGTLVAVGAWLLLDDDLIQVVLGALLLGHGAVLMLMAPRVAGAPPLLGPGGTIPEAIGDPVPQALALTAIVISFGVATLLLALIRVISGEEAEQDVADEPRHAATDALAVRAGGTADVEQPADRGRAPQSSAVSDGRDDHVEVGA